LDRKYLGRDEIRAGGFSVLKFGPDPRKMSSAMAPLTVAIARRRLIRRRRAPFGST
jgi:hypothetical protein